MAHLVETIAYAGEVPWHGLGVPVNNDLTPEEILKKADLNWTVEAMPLYAKVGKKHVLVPEKNALVRSSDERVLTIISDDWKPVQNTEAFDFFKDFVKNGDMEMNTAGSLRDGNMVWALAKVKESFSLFKGKDVVESYLLFSNPHEYGKSIDIRFTPIRVVCNNTLTLSLSSKSDMMVRLNHRRAFDAEQVKQTLGIAHNKLTQYKDVAEFLASKRYSEQSVLEYLKKLFPHSNTQTQANDNDKMSRPARLSYDSLHTQPGAKMGEGTWWQAFNSVTFNTDHVLGHSNKTRMNSVWYGPMRNKKIEALELATEFAKAA
jgi:phage/plasmid-like protein (TIGR03299 family)